MVYDARMMEYVPLRPEGVFSPLFLLLTLPFGNGISSSQTSLEIVFLHERRPHPLLDDLRTSSPTLLPDAYHPSVYMGSAPALKWRAISSCTNCVLSDVDFV